MRRIAGRIANRNFSRDEWRQYFPDKPYRPTFPAGSSPSRRRLLLAMGK